MKIKLLGAALLLWASLALAEGNDLAKFTGAADKTAEMLRVRIIAEAATLENHPWAGEYYCGNGLSKNVRLLLAPESGFLFEWQGCKGLYDRNYGRVSEADGSLQLTFTFKNERKELQGIEEHFVPVVWGERHYLIPSEEAAEFCKAESRGGEPREDPHGRYLLRQGDWKKPATGSPLLAATSRVVTHTIKSPYQPEPVAVEVLAPDALDPQRHYPVLYILPVAAGTTSKWGSGIQEAAKADIANRYQVICVAPAFTATPWFADHPTDPALQQESHFIKAVIPWVESNYPAEKTRAGRFLLGFSKSGYGAVMLLLRHPELFERALAWDAPLGKTQPDQFKMIDVFGTPENFAHYAIPELLKVRAAELKSGPPRLFLMPDKEGDHPMENVRQQLEDLAIPHGIEYTTGCRHSWESGWFPRAAELVITGEIGASK